MFKDPWSVFLYPLVGALLLAGLWLGSTWPIWLAVLALAVWDVTFVSTSEAFAGRTPRNVLDSAQRARQYLQWFFVFYGVLFGALVATGPETHTAFMDALERTHVPRWFLLMPLFLASVAIIFVPIQISTEDGQGKPTRALRAHVFILVFLQQVATLTFAFAVGRLLLSGLG